MSSARTEPEGYGPTDVRSMESRVAELEEEQRRLQGALDELPDPVLVLHEDFQVIWSNQRADELLVTREGDSTERRHAVETNNLFFSTFREHAVLEDLPGPVSRELSLVDPDGGAGLTYEVFVSRFDEDAFREGRWIFFLRDITALRRATNELEIQFGRSIAAEHRARRESDRLNVIIGNAGVPILVMDGSARITLMNREAERLLGQGAGEAVGPPRTQDIRDNRAKMEGFLDEFLRQPRLRQEGRLTLVDPEEARELPMQVMSTKILDERHEPTAVVTVLHDRTDEVENRHLAEQLRTLNEELEERVALATRELEERNRELEGQRAELLRASTLKSEFLQTMSHELRTPINAILGYNSLLREGLFGELNPKQKSSLERMRRAAGHLLSLINDILDLSLVEAGRMHVRATEIELNRFLETLSGAVRVSAESKGLTYRIEVDDDVPRIRSDETRLRQVLLNLLSNAVKFTDSGSVEVRASRVKGEDRVALEVRDTGIGISEGDLEVIFQEFTQVDQSATREHGGAGLGLAISRRLVGLMGGSLSVSSVVGEGTTFRIELPLTPPDGWKDQAEGVA